MKKLAIAIIVVLVVQVIFEIGGAVCDYKNNPQHAISHLAGFIACLHFYADYGRQR